MIVYFYVLSVSKCFFNTQGLHDARTNINFDQLLAPRLTGFTLDFFKKMDSCFNRWKVAPSPCQHLLAMYESLTLFWRIAVGIPGTTVKLLKLSRVCALNRLSILRKLIGCVCLQTEIVSPA